MGRTAGVEMDTSEREEGGSRQKNVRKFKECVHPVPNGCTPSALSTSFTPGRGSNLAVLFSCASEVAR